MRDLASEILGYLNARRGLHAELLIWLSGINKQTSQTETLGFWTGALPRDFAINGQTRQYVGAGSVVQVPALTSEIGLRVRTTRLQLSPLNEDVQNAILQYDVRLQPVEMHVVYSPASGADIIGEPVRIFEGLIGGLSLNEPKPGGEAGCDLSLLSTAVYLTQSLALRKSSNALLARSEGDYFRRYSDVSGVIETVWGSTRA